MTVGDQLDTRRWQGMGRYAICVHGIDTHIDFRKKQSDVGTRPLRAAVVQLVETIGGSIPISNGDGGAREREESLLSNGVSKLDGT